MHQITYSDDIPLVISRPVTVVGCGMTEDGPNTIINCLVIMQNSPVPQANSTLVLRDCRCLKGLKINCTINENIQLINLHISLPNARINYERQVVTNTDCVEVTNCKNLLINGCEIHGGQDGLGLNGYDIKAHIKNTEIKYPCCRGIFANHDFVIEDSVVSDCGSYGMKTRGGATRRGKCIIQSGPWDNSPF